MSQSADLGDVDWFKKRRNTTAPVTPDRQQSEHIVSCITEVAAPWVGSDDSTLTMVASEMAHTCATVYSTHMHARAHAHAHTHTHTHTHTHMQVAVVSTSDYDSRGPRSNPRCRQLLSSSSSCIFIKLCQNADSTIF